MTPGPNLTHSSSGVRMPAENMESTTSVLNASASATFIVGTLVQKSLTTPSSIVLLFRSGSPSAISRIQTVIPLKAQGSVQRLISVLVSLEGTNFLLLPVGRVIM